MTKNSKLHKAALSFSLILISSAVTERSIYGTALTSLVLLVLLGVVALPIGIILDRTNLSSPARVLCAAACLAIYAFAIHWVSFSQYFDAGTLYVGTTALVVSGQVTMFGYLYTAFYASVLCAATFILTVGKSRHV